MYSSMLHNLYVIIKVIRSNNYIYNIVTVTLNYILILQQHSENNMIKQKRFSTNRPTQCVIMQLEDQKFPYLVRL